MARSHLIWIGTALLLALSWGHGSVRTAAAQGEDVSKVSADDLASGKVTVVGRLGIPLRTMITVRGTWRSLPPLRHGNARKPADHSFYVSHVNGNALAKPVEFVRGLVRGTTADGTELTELKPADGEQWELRVYETGGFRGQPAEYWKERGDGIPQYPHWGQGAFVTELDGILKNSVAPSQKSKKREGEKAR